MAKILISINDHSIEDAICFDLKGVGHETILAKTSLEAKEKLTEGAELVITDLHDRLEEGKTLLQVVKANDPAKIPFVVLTSSDVRSMEELYDQGAEIVFQPPYNRRSVLQVVEDALERIAKSNWGAPRIEADFSVRIKEEGADQTKTFNIGRGGMFIQCAPPIPPIDSALNFILELSDGKEIEGSAIVRWQRRFEESGLPRGVGVEFISLSEEGQETITRFVNKQRLESYIPKS